MIETRNENTFHFEDVSRPFRSYKIRYCSDIWCNHRNCVGNYMFWIHFQKIENKSCNQETSSGCHCATVFRIWNFLWFSLGDWVWNPKQSDLLLCIYFYHCKYNWITSINFHDICHKVIFYRLFTQMKLPRKTLKSSCWTLNSANTVQTAWI